MNPLMTINEVAAALATTRATVRNMWYGGTLPAPIRIGRRGIRWRADELAEFIAAREPVKNPQGAAR